MLKHIRRLMSLIYAIFILLLALITSAQCQQTPEEWFNKGMALYGQSRYEEAIKAYDEAITLDPNDANAWYNKGNVLDDLGRYDEAIKAYDEAIRLDPNDAAVKSKKGVALFSQGKYDEAIKCYDEAIRLDPNDANAWYNKGNALRRLHRNSEAKEAFVKAGSLKVTNRGIMSSSDYGNNVDNIERKNEIDYAPPETEPEPIMIDYAPPEPYVIGDVIAKQKRIDDAIAEQKAIDDADKQKAINNATAAAAGALVFNPPNVMQYDVEEFISARICANNTTKLIQGLLGKGELRYRDIDVTTNLTYVVTLNGDCFNITSMRPNAQVLGKNPAEWIWLVTPSEAGNHTLILSVDLQVEKPPFNSMYVNVTTWPVLVEVKKQSLLEQAENISNEIYVIIGSLIVFLTGLFSLYFLIKRKRADNG